MAPSDAALLTALLVLAILAAAWCHLRGGGEAFAPDPHAIGLYDHPYAGYPAYEGRRAVWWDEDRRCASYCAAGGCAVWCR